MVGLVVSFFRGICCIDVKTGLEMRRPREKLDLSIKGCTYTLAKQSARSTVQSMEFAFLRCFKDEQFRKLFEYMKSDWKSGEVVLCIRNYTGSRHSVGSYVKWIRNAVCRMSEAEKTTYFSTTHGLFFMSRDELSESNRVYIEEGQDEGCGTVLLKCAYPVVGSGTVSGLLMCEL